MKILLNAIAAISLATSVVAPILTNINSSNLQYINEIDAYNFNLQLDNVINEKGQQSYNFFANVQAIIQHFNHKAPKQITLKYEIERKINEGKSVEEAVSEIIKNYTSKSYYAAVIPKDFYKKDKEKLFFQAAITHSLVRGYPVLINGLGIIPGWISNQPISFYSTIYSVSTSNANKAEEGVYFLIDTLSGYADSRIRLQADWGIEKMFQAQSYIFLPSQNFDFAKKQISIKPNVKDANINTTIPSGKQEEAVETVDLLYEAGINSFVFFKNYIVMLNLSMSSIYYAWKNHVLTGLGKQTWLISREMEEPISEWVIDEDSSVEWLSDYSKILIDFSYRYMYQNKKLNFSFATFVFGNTGGQDPYVGVSMGFNWTLLFT